MAKEIEDILKTKWLLEWVLSLREIVQGLLYWMPTFDGISRYNEHKVYALQKKVNG